MVHQSVAADKWHHLILKVTLLQIEPFPTNLMAFDTSGFCSIAFRLIEAIRRLQDSLSLCIYQVTLFKLQ